jgi:hypothetical protein
MDDKPVYREKSVNPAYRPAIFLAIALSNCSLRCGSHEKLLAKEIQTFLDFPPMQRGGGFNVDALKAEMARRMAEAEAAAKGPRN